MIEDIEQPSARVSKDHQDTAKLKLELTGSKEGIFIEADKSRINQVVSNLLSSTIKTFFFLLLYFVVSVVIYYSILRLMCPLADY